MKTRVCKKEPGFVPVDVTFTCETQEELNWLHTLFNCHVSGSDSVCSLVRKMQNLGAKNDPQVSTIWKKRNKNSFPSAFPAPGQTE